MTIWNHCKCLSSYIEVILAKNFQKEVVFLSIPKMKSSIFHLVQSSLAALPIRGSHLAPKDTPIKPNIILLDKVGRLPGKLHFNKAIDCHIFSNLLSNSQLCKIRKNLYVLTTCFQKCQERCKFKCHTNVALHW